MHQIAYENSTRSPAVAEKADRTAYNALINYHSQTFVAT